jgi:hypothetical protein
MIVSADLTRQTEVRKVLSKMARFEATKDKNDFAMDISATDIAVPASAWTEVGSLTIGAQTAIQYGVGDTKGGVDTRETATIRLDSAAGQITGGKLRLRVADANENNEKTVAEGLLSEWSAGKKVGLTGVKAGEDDILKVEVNFTSATTIDFSDTDNSVSIPVTVDTRR